MLSVLFRLHARGGRQGGLLVRSFVKIGDKVPVKYMKDVPEPVILKDEEYPEWVMRLHLKLPNKRQMMDQIETQGIDSLTERQIKRTKRLITKEDIKNKNLQSLG